MNVSTNNYRKIRKSPSIFNLTRITICLISLTALNSFSLNQFSTILSRQKGHDDRYAFTVLRARSSQAGRRERISNPKKKRKSNTKHASKKENSKRTRVGNENKARNKVNSNTAHLPPWQIMSEKDTKKNIEEEKRRRASIREGSIPSSTEAADKTANASSSSHLLSLSDRRLLAWKRFSQREGQSQKLEFSGAYLGTEGMESMGVPGRSYRRDIPVTP